MSICSSLARDLDSFHPVAAATTWAGGGGGGEGGEVAAKRTRQNGPFFLFLGRTAQQGGGGILCFCFEQSGTQMRSVQQTMKATMANFHLLEPPGKIPMSSSDKSPLRPTNKGKYYYHYHYHYHYYYYYY